MSSNNPFRTLSRKFIIRETLAEDLNSLKAAGKKIAFTNGCFDILHIGHIRYLQDAREYGDVLIVGVNSDSSVKKLKGEDRPINSEIQRVEVLTALECVDYVVVFNEGTPIETILLIKPDIHIKGGDYTINDLPETAHVESYGGKVVIIPLSKTNSECYSTTRIIEKMVL